MNYLNYSSICSLNACISKLSFAPFGGKFKQRTMKRSDIQECITTTTQQQQQMKINVYFLLDNHFQNPDFRYTGPWYLVYLSGCVVWCRGSSSTILLLRERHRYKLRNCNHFAQIACKGTRISIQPRN